MNESASTARIRGTRTTTARRTLCQTFSVALSAALLLLAAAASADVAAQTRSGRRGGSSRTERTTANTTPLPSLEPLPPAVNPFEAVEAASDAGLVTDLALKPTALEPKADADADVSLTNGVLLVRLRAKNVPLPSRFDVPRYALWVYVPNYDYKLYIGDLPITRTKGDRGSSDSAYRFTRLPRDAQFGGLMLTAEPVRFTPIVNEALRPVLVGLVKDASPEKALAAVAIYAAPEGVVTGAPPPTPASGGGGRSNRRPPRRTNQPR